MAEANLASSRVQNILTIFHSMKEVLPITVIPITFATLMMILNYAYRSKKLTESLPFVLM